MGFRFRKSIKLLPGVRINLSKSGVSTSIGRPGATINVSDKGVRGTVGVPGTGVSYSERLTTSDAPSPSRSGIGLSALLGLGLAALFLALFHFGIV